MLMQLNTSSKSFPQFGGFLNIISLIVCLILFYVLSHNFNYSWLYNIDSSFYNYFIINWSLDFITYTDVMLFGYFLYESYPFTLYLISVFLWLVLMGVLYISRTN